MPFTSPENPTLARPLRVLLVDDQATTRLAIQHLLRYLLYEADAVANGREALEVLKKRDYDVVLMDLRMPEMGGLETTRLLRMLPSNGHRPRVIALSADDSPEDRESCLAVGMDDLVVKPLTRNRLVQALEREAVLSA